MGLIVGSNYSGSLVGKKGVTQTIDPRKKKVLGTEIIDTGVPINLTPAQLMGARGADPHDTAQYKQISDQPTNYDSIFPGASTFAATSGGGGNVSLPSYVPPIGGYNGSGGNVGSAEPASFSTERAIKLKNQADNTFTQLTQVDPNQFNQDQQQQQKQQPAPQQQNPDQQDFASFINPNTDQVIKRTNPSQNDVQSMQKQGFQLAEAQTSKPLSLTQDPELARAQNETQSAAAELSTLTKQLDGFLTNDKDLRQQAQAITQQWDARIAQMQDINQRREQALTTTGIRLGSRWTGGAGGMFGGIVAEEERQGIMRIGDLEAQKQQALTEAKIAADSKNYQVYVQKVNLAKAMYDDKARQLAVVQATVQKQNEALQVEQRAVARDSAVAELIKQGTTDPTDIFNAINFDQQGKPIGNFNAQEIADSVKNLSANNPTLKDQLDITLKQLDIKKKIQDLSQRPDVAPAVLSKVQTVANGFDKSNIVKNFTDLQNKASSVQQIISSGVGGPGDLALVFDFMKALDPTSVVRESEYATAAQSGNIFAGAFARFNGYLKEQGGFLPDNVKQAFNQIVDIKYKAVEKQYDNLYSEQARRINLLTGNKDGSDYLTQYKFDMAKPSYSSLDDYYVANPNERPRVEQMAKDHPELSDEEMLQILNSGDGTDNKDMSYNINIPQSSALAYNNNNPGNLRFAGQSGAVVGENGFAHFSTPEAGYKALKDQIRLDAQRGLNLQDFITKYAPPSDKNDTKGYIRDIAKQLKISPSAPIDSINSDVFAQAIMNRESGAKIYG